VAVNLGPPESTTVTPAYFAGRVCRFQAGPNVNIAGRLVVGAVGRAS
jgi:hypothetical protein